MCGEGAYTARGAAVVVVLQRCRQTVGGYEVHGLRGT